MLTWPFRKRASFQFHHVDLIPPELKLVDKPARFTIYFALPDDLAVMVNAGLTPNRMRGSKPRRDCNSRHGASEWSASTHSEAEIAVPSPPKFRETQTWPDDGRRPLPVRLTHWVNAFAMTCMITSGWQIYNASPIFSMTFPRWSTLGGWLAGGIAIHFAAMWLLVANGLFYIAYGLLSGYFRVPAAADPGSGRRGLRRSAHIQPETRARHLQCRSELLYIVVLLLGAGAVLSGLAIWKPVQFAPLTALLGGYDTARVVHFLAMAGIVGFITTHPALVALVPKSLLSMITGHGAAPGLVHRTGPRT